MLRLSEIVKNYRVGDGEVQALKGVSLAFRRNEFVSILGASGCGKTTLLNIIGGLDKYTSGDLVIDGVSTKNYKDGDWDTYRNHRIGFVFQSYNLIPHQTVLGNVELALTISGVSKKERRERAKNALERVGLGKEINKRPNQLSGGQMQRVAIARALVNDPEILLADEPTGALDSNTSVQIMELIKDIAGDRLVIMVTHNPELAKEYSTRIVELSDGKVIADSNPYSEQEERAEVEAFAKAESKKAEEEQLAENSGVKGKKRGKKARMSMLTAFALSGRNLLTKKARTAITSVAGSIGIISVCLVLALSNGFSNYIARTEEDMLSYYPVTVSETSLDFTAAMTSFMGGGNKLEIDKIEDKVYIDSFLTQLAKGMTTTNDLSSDNTIDKDGEKLDYFAYIEKMPSEYYNAISYSYGLSLADNIYTDITIGSSPLTQLQETDVHMSLSLLRSYYETELEKSQSQFTALSGFVSMFTNVINFMPSTSDFNASDYGEYVLSQYDVAGTFPENENEIVLVVGQNSTATDITLAQLGFIDEEEFLGLFITDEEDDGEVLSIPYYDVKDENGNVVQKGIIGTTYTLYDDDAIYKDGTGSSYKYLYDGFTKDDKLSGATEENSRTLKITAVLKLKEGLTYGCLSEGLNLTEKLQTEFIARNKNSQIVQYLSSLEDSQFPENIAGSRDIYSIEGEAVYKQKFGTTQSDLAATDTLSLIRYLGGNDRPNEIKFFARDFATKDDMLTYLDGWNDAAAQARLEYMNAHGGSATGYNGPTEIKYTDTVGVLMDLMDTILNAITYVLVAFTGISLVVSTVMIGVITYVSVVERVKEIGVLRSIGARKKDIRHLFNAETFMIGLFAGIIGVVIAYLLQGVINLILTPLVGISGLAALPLWQAVIMVCVSVALTLVSGLIPASAAAKKDPVIALRTE